MKKNKRTAATAAMFATALNMALGSVAIPNGSQPLNAKADEPEYDPALEIQEDVYGPPEFFEVTTTTNEQYDPVTELTTTMAVVYGPPSMMTTTYDDPIQEAETTMAEVYGPPSFFARGDINWDGSTDVFDLIQFRKEYVESMTNDRHYGYTEFDVNSDGMFGVADLVALNRFLLGRSTDLNWYYDTEEEPVPQPEYGPPYEPIEQPVYGPPVDYDENDDEEQVQTTTMRQDGLWEETTTTTATEPIVQPVYGPPPVFEN